MSPKPAVADNATPSLSGHTALGAALLVVAAAASAMLVAHHLGGGLPGCGPESACDNLARTFWGKVPGIGWPTAHLGLTFFLALLVGWIASRGRLSGGLLPVAAIGGLFSLLLLGVMVAEKKLCPYCVAAHLANLAFLVVAWTRRGATAAGGRGRRRGRADSGTTSRGASRGLLGFVSVFVVATAVLALAEWQTRSARDARAEADRAESARRMTENAGNSQTATDPEARWGDLGFRGRYLHGPRDAAIRVVMITDYQCPDCKKVETQLRAVLEERKDIHLSIKHFPMCREAGNGEICNRHLDRTLHRNACWAARAAEAAGMVGGDAAFFRMHFWLFDRGGEFTRAELDTQVAAMGLDSEKFYAAMEGRESLERVRADIEDGYDLGLHFTPMVFINGVELKGWQAPDAVARTVAQVAASNPQPRRAGSDRPVFAQAKYVADWIEQPKQRLPGDEWPRIFGKESVSPGDPLVEVTVWGDYQEENSALVDAAIRAYLSGRDDVRYHFRHYPVDPECNRALPPNVPATSIHPRACWAARAAEATAKIGGSDAYQRAHVWLMERWNTLDSATLAEIAKAAEVPLGRLEEEMESAEVRASLDEDAQAATRLGVRSIPLVYVDGKRVPRVRREGEVVMDWILERATGGSAEPAR